MTSKILSPDSQFNVTIDQTKLSNLVAIGIYVRAGSMHEKESVKGASHFIEHMAFKNTVLRADLEMNQRMEIYGARHNAYTTNDATHFYAIAPKSNYLKVLGLLIEMLYPAFNQDQFESEKKVILEEIQMYQDQPETFLSERLQEKFYEKTSLAHPILGTKNDICGMDCSTLYKYYKQAYDIKNIHIVISGEVEPDQTLLYLEDTRRSLEKYDNIEARDEDKTNYYLKDFNIKPEYENRRFQFSSQSQAMRYYQVMMPAPSSRSTDKNIAKIWLELFSGDHNSLLHYELVQAGLAEEISYEYFAGRDIGHTHFYSSSSESELETSWYSNFEQMCDPDYLRLRFKELDVERVKLKLISQYLQQQETTIGRLRYLGESWIEKGEISYIEDEIKGLKSLKYSDLLQYAANLSGQQLSHATLSSP